MAGESASLSISKTVDGVKRAAMIWTDVIFSIDLNAAPRY